MQGNESVKRTDLSLGCGWNWNHFLFKFHINFIFYGTKWTFRNSNLFKLQDLTDSILYQIPNFLIFSTTGKLKFDATSKLSKGNALWLDHIIRFNFSLLTYVPYRWCFYESSFRVTRHLYIKYNKTSSKRSQKPIISRKTTSGNSEEEHCLVYLANTTFNICDENIVTNFHILFMCKCRFLKN